MHKVVGLTEVHITFCCHRSKNNPSPQNRQETRLDSYITYLHFDDIVSTALARSRHKKGEGHLFLWRKGGDKCILPNLVPRLFQLTAPAPEGGGREMKEPGNEVVFVQGLLCAAHIRFRWFNSVFTTNPMQRASVRLLSPFPGSNISIIWRSNPTPPGQSLVPGGSGVVWCPQVQRLWIAHYCPGGERVVWAVSLGSSNCTCVPYSLEGRSDGAYADRGAWSLQTADRRL